MEEKLRKAIKQCLHELGHDGIKFDIERPADMSHGDYATNIALKAFGPISHGPFSNAFETGGTWTVRQESNFKDKFKSPRDFAELIKDKLIQLLPDAALIEVAGPGFINMTVARDAITADIERAAAEGGEWGTGNAQAGKRVMVEYSNPNPFKEMHIGHLMSTIEGEAIARVIESQGATVLRDTFGGDVGPHVAKALWALAQKGITDIASAKEIGIAYAHGSNAYDESEEAHKEIDELNTRIYAIVGAQDDEAALSALSEDDRILLELWRKGREVSMEEFRRLYTILGTKFDYVFYDSDTTKDGMDAVMAGVEKGIFEKSDGAIIYRGEKHGKERNLHTLVFITSRGTPTYETKDIGLAFLKEERVQTDEIIIITAVEQVGHFEVVLAALEEIAPLVAKKMKHVPHGLLRLTTGKMSSRKGNIITASELLHDVIERALEKNEDPIVAEQVGVGAVKYSILKQSAGSDIIFDVDKSLSLEGDSGPYLQYATVRAKSVIEKASGEEHDSEKAEQRMAARSAASRGIPPEPYAIERLIARFPEIVARSARDLAPHHIAQYLTTLAGEWNSFYANERVIGGDYEDYKLSIARAFVQTMQNGLALLGIPVPEKM